MNEIIDLNANQAAIRAGYSKKTAKQQGHRLLTKVDVQAEIQKNVQARSERTELTQDYVINGLREIAERCLQKVPVMVYHREAGCAKQTIDDNTGECIWKFDSAGATRALDLLGKHLGIFDKDNSEKGVVVNIITEYIEKPVNAGLSSDNISD